MAQKMQVGPCIPVGIQRQKAEVGPASGPTWRVPHLLILVVDRRVRRAGQDPGRAHVLRDSVRVVEDDEPAGVVRAHRHVVPAGVIREGGTDNIVSASLQNLSRVTHCESAMGHAGQNKRRLTPCATSGRSPGSPHRCARWPCRSCASSGAGAGRSRGRAGWSRRRTRSGSPPPRQREGC